MSLDIHPSHQFNEPTPGSKSFEALAGRTVEGTLRVCQGCQGEHFQAPGHEAIDLRLRSQCAPPLRRNGMTLY